MKRAKPESAEKGMRGLGNLVRLSADKVRMDFEDGVSKPIAVSEETVPEVLRKVIAKMPDNSKIGIEATLDLEEKKILFCKPVVGTFDFKFIKFYAKGDTAPVMETAVGKGGKPYRHFSGVVEVQNKTGVKSDLWSGIRYNVKFFDNFGKDEDGNLLVLSKGDSSDFLNDFLDVIGMSQHTIPYSENPLPAIEKLALQEGKIFSGDVRKVVSGGKSYANVTSFNTFALDDSIFEEEESGEHPALAE